MSYIRPRGDRVVIEHIEAADVSRGGVVIPDNAKERPQEGWVIEVSFQLDGRIDLRVGDRVIYSKYAGTELKVDDREVLIVSEKDVLAVVGHRSIEVSATARDVKEYLRSAAAEVQ